jgi:hypothetical protein
MVLILAHDVNNKDNKITIWSLQLVINKYIPATDIKIL